MNQTTETQPRIPIGKQIADAVSRSYDAPFGTPIFSALQTRRRRDGYPIHTFAGIGSRTDTTTAHGRDEYLAAHAHVDRRRAKNRAGRRQRRINRLRARR